ncbi:hypothetical protein T492DRAFT_134755 [Pavlovales sp. CCMP2436]|nr:hypothetical protein T492DRAFT_134755 [Pavlovales sp. CCMP2436]
MRGGAGLALVLATVLVLANSGLRSLARALATATELLVLCVAALAVGAWQVRAELLPLALRHAKRLELTVASIAVDVGWARAPLTQLRGRGAPFDRLLLGAKAFALYTPYAEAATASAGPAGSRASAAATGARGVIERPGCDRFVRAELVRVRVTREAGGHGGVLEVAGLDIRFVSYDLLFRDTNVSRLVELLSSGSEPKIPHFTLRRIVLRDATIWIELNLSGSPGGAVPMIPPIRIESGEIDLDELASANAAPLVILGWFNGFVLRALSNASQVAGAGRQQMHAALQLPAARASEVRMKLFSLGYICNLFFFFKVRLTQYCLI